MTKRHQRKHDVFRVALVGAESTGKTTLADNLAGHLCGVGYVVAVVPEVLREWCVLHHRTPRQHEQLAIGKEQARRAIRLSHELEGIRGESPAVLIADTTPLMTAVYSDVLFGDSSLHRAALAHQRWYDQTLLLEPDIPWIADGIRDGEAIRSQVHARLLILVEQLARWQAVRGSKGHRLANTLASLESPNQRHNLAKMPHSASGI